MKALPLILFALTIFLTGCRTAPEKPPVPEAYKPLVAACDYLWSKQGADGGWHSEVHALFRGGSALTPFILHALLAVPDSVYPRDAAKVTLGLDFIRSHVNDTGVIGLSDPDILEYPNYSTAYAVRVLVSGGHAKDQMLIRKMTDYLIRQQYDEDRGILPSHAAYGAWGFGEQFIPSGQTGHVDLSHTRRVLQALKDAGMLTAEISSRATIFLNHVQKHPSDTRRQPADTSDSGLHPFYDGGFYYSPIQYTANKAGQQPADSAHAATFRSYATATCDGSLALLANGFSPGDTRVQDASKWLREHPELDRPGGIPVDDPDEWWTVMKFYHLCVRAEASFAVEPSGAWKEPLREFVKKEQKPDGSFSNPLGGRNKEDDPLLATAFAVVALNLSR